jgi:salicylate hydroxylase
LDQLRDREAIETRLRLFEQIRRNRGSSLQILSSSSHPAPQSVRDAAAKYLPDGKELKNADDVTEYLFSYDVIKECKAVLA